MTLKSTLIGAGFAGFRLSGLHRLMGAATRGSGLILTFHRVRPFNEPTPGYAPNNLLEITPEFLDQAIQAVRRSGFALVTLDEARRRLVERDDAPFAALTFDDGYRDTRAVALPILERHQAPFTVYCAPGFLDRTAQLWWLELEEAVRRLDHVVTTVAGARLDLPARDAAEKRAAYERLYWTLRALPEPELLKTAATLAREAAVSSATLAEEIFMDWDELAALSRHPLASIGAHTMTHRRLALWPAEEARSEMADSRASLEARLDVAVRHLAYPVGDPTSAGAREFAMARDLGFATAVTTRPGMLFSGHADHLTALPRVSINGRWQSAEALDVLLSGAPFWLWNRGRRVNAA